MFLLFPTIVEATELSTSVPSGSQYAPERNYGFQIKCDDIPSVSSVTFEWNSVNNDTANNDSADTFYYNLTDLDVGSYSYRWIVDNTSHIMVFSNTYSVAINSSVDIILSLDGTEGDKSYDLYDITNFIVTLNIPNKNVKLESNYPNWATVQNSTSQITNSTNLTELGVFSLTASWNGDENYTSSSVTYYFDSGPPLFSSITSIPHSIVGYIPRIEYRFEVTCIDATLVDVWFESNHTGEMKSYYATSNLSVQNSSGSFWIIISDLGAGKFNYRWHAKDDTDDKSTTGFMEYEILKMTPLIMEISPSLNIQEGTQITAECRSVNSQEIPASDFGFYKDDELIENITTTARLDNFLLSIGTYNFTCNTTGSANYTNQSWSRIITVSAGPPEDDGITEGELRITNTIFPSIETGETREASFNLVNNMLRNIFNITIELIGISSDWYTITQPSYIYSGDTEEVKIDFNIPSDAEAKTYGITINVNGNTHDGEDISVTKDVDVLITSPVQNEPPSYSTSNINTTVAGSVAMFSLEWSDDDGLSGYIFSSNISGTWENDSWVPLTDESGWIDVIKILNSSIGSVVGWKIYANDTDNEWAVSDEYIVKVTAAAGFDMTFILIILIVVAILIAVLIFIRKIKPKVEEEEVEYVYNREDYEKRRTKVSLALLKLLN